LSFTAFFAMPAVFAYGTTVATRFAAACPYGVAARQETNSAAADKMIGSRLIIDSLLLSVVRSATDRRFPSRRRDRAA
jgi:hypothetical protein